MTKYLFPNLFNKSQPLMLHEMSFFYLPLGKNVFTFLGLHLFNYTVGSYWIWQALKRRFRSPEATVLSKGQSYLLVACSQVILWGFTLQYTKNYCPSYLKSQPINCYYDLNHQIGQNFGFIGLFNIVLLIGLLVILSPHRQQIQDWARYRYQQTPSHSTVGNKSLWQDLFWNDKSPVIVTMGISLIMIAIPLLVWILLAPALNIHNNNSIDWVNSIGRMKAVLAVVMFINIIMISATITQIMLLLKTFKQSVLAIATVYLVMFLISGIFGIVMSMLPEPNSFWWLFSPLPWLGLEQSEITTVFLSIFAEFIVLALLNWYLINQIKLAGESATKALLAGR
ncbi:hypothetical protein LC593_09325 [Nostoc sp. CHAB 5844]|nr:hypothetical protein [Nostoc sp. CHAB 5844]